VDYATVGFSANPVDIAPGETITIALTFKMPKKGDATQWPIYSGYVIATPKTVGSVAVHVPYTGLKGDFSQIPIQDTDAAWPQLDVRDVNGNLIPVAPGTQLDVSGPTIEYLPVIAVREVSPTPRFTIRVYDQRHVFQGYLYSPDLGVANVTLGRTSTDGPEQWTWLGQIVRDGDSTVITLPSTGFRLEVASQRKYTPGVYPQDFEIFDLGVWFITTTSSNPVTSN
ncbi:hypothetical protein BGZ99_000256, partial [Dissophora globulifera]